MFHRWLLCFIAVSSGPTFAALSVSDCLAGVVKVGAVIANNPLVRPALALVPPLNFAQQAPEVLFGDDGRISFLVSDRKQPGLPVFDTVLEALRRPTGSHKLSEVFRNLLAQNRDKVFTEFFKVSHTTVEYDRTQADKIPRTGSVAFVANHPAFGVETVAIATILESIGRLDFKILLNPFLEALRPFRENFIYVNPFGSDHAPENRQGLRQLLQHTKRGGAVIIHPAGSISDQWSAELGRYVDTPWKSGIGGLVARSVDYVVPIFADVKASRLFYLVRSLAGPPASLFLMPREIAGLLGTTIRLNIGDAIPASEFRRGEASASLYDAVYHLAPRP